MLATSGGQVIGMLRSKSLPCMPHAAQESSMRGHMPYPNMHERKEEFRGQSYAVIKASPNESKFMHAMLEAKDGVLNISIVQAQQGVLQTFRIARLAIKHLIVCWQWNRHDVFIVCMDVAGSLQGDIWCYTAPSLRNKWLSTLQNYGARTAHMGPYIKGMHIFDNLHMQLPEVPQKRRKKADLQLHKREDYFWLQACVVLLGSVIAEMWMDGFSFF
jgi:hypothetical protein